jgi:ABC-type multidrug transport system ATPase subunit
MQLHLEKVSKQYKNGPKALDDVSLHIKSGMFGLLGPNGAGKSTLMRTLATLQLPDSGSMVFNGVDIAGAPHEIRQSLGYLPQDFGVYPRVKARDLLMHIAWVKGINDKKQRSELVEYTLEMVNLGQHKEKALGSFSGGMKQRFGIAQAIIGDPKLLIVDEPTAGLDPVERNRFYNILSELSSEMVVLLSTHIVEDVNTLCESVAILNQGRIIAQGKPSELIHQLDGKISTIQIHKDALTEASAQYKILSKVLREGNYVLRVYNTSDEGAGLSSTEPNLEDYYFAAINAYLPNQ